MARPDDRSFVVDHSAATAIRTATTIGAATKEIASASGTARRRVAAAGKH